MVTYRLNQARVQLSEKYKILTKFVFFFSIIIFQFRLIDIEIFPIKYSGVEVGLYGDRGFLSSSRLAKQEWKLELGLNIISSSGRSQALFFKHRCD